MSLVRIRPENMREVEVFNLELDKIPLSIRINRNAKGKVNEIYVMAGKHGTLINGFMETFSRMASRMLQYGIPIKDIIEICKEQNYEPKGFVKGHPRIEVCDSILDLIAKVLIDEDLDSLTR